MIHRDVQVLEISRQNLLVSIIVWFFRYEPNKWCTGTFNTNRRQSVSLTGTFITATTFLSMLTQSYFALKQHSEWLKQPSNTCDQAFCSYLEHVLLAVLDEI